MGPHLWRRTYFDQGLSDAAGQRDSYFRAAFAALAKCDVIFFDPDNGIEVSSTQRGQRGSARYIYWKELQEAYTTGHSLLVYQHFPRVERAAFVPFLADRLGEQLGASAVVAFLTSHVSFFLVPQTRHGVALEKALETVRLRWRGQIDVSQPIEEANEQALAADGGPDRSLANSRQRALLITGKGSYRNFVGVSGPETESPHLMRINLITVLLRRRTESYMSGLTTEPCLVILVTCLIPEK